MTHPRSQPGTAAAIDYGPAPNDCDITPGKFWTAVVVCYAVLKALLISRVIA